MRTVLLTALLLWIPLGVAAQSASNVPLELVARADRFTGLSNAQINERGDVAFYGERDGEQGIWLSLGPEGVGRTIPAELVASESALGSASSFRLAHWVLDDTGHVTVMVMTSVSPEVRELWRAGTDGASRLIGDGDPCPDDASRTATLLPDFRVSPSGVLLFQGGACGANTWVGGATEPTRIDASERTVTGHPLGLTITDTSIGPLWAFNANGDIAYYGNGRCRLPSCMRPPGLLSTGGGLYRLDGGAVDITGVHFDGEDETLIGGAPGEYLFGRSAISLADDGRVSIFAAGSSAPSDPAVLEGDSDRLRIVARRGDEAFSPGSTWVRVGLNPAENEERFWQVQGGRVLFEGETAGPIVAGIFDGSGAVAPWPAPIDEPADGTELERATDVRVSRDGLIALVGTLRGADVRMTNRDAVVARVDREGIGYRIVARAGTTVTLGYDEFTFAESETFLLGAEARGVPGTPFTRARTSSGMDGRGRAFATRGRLVFIAASVGVLVARPLDKLPPVDRGIAFEPPNRLIITVVGDAREHSTVEIRPIAGVDGGVGGPPIAADNPTCAFDGSYTVCQVDPEARSVLTLTIPAEPPPLVVATVRSQILDPNLTNNAVEFSFGGDGGVGADGGDAPLDGGPMDAGPEEDGGGCRVAEGREGGSAVWLALFAMALVVRRARSVC